MMVWSFNSNTTSGASSGEGTAFPFGTHKIYPAFPFETHEFSHFVCASCCLIL